jgi:hypothetical protein
VKRHDVTDPASPVEESWWRAPGEASFWTARAVTTGPDGFFVGSSRGVDPVPGRLYTFPDRRGSQSEPPSLGASSTATPSPSTADSSVTLPGFGPVAGLAALGLGGWWLRRRGHD